MSIAVRAPYSDDLGELGTKYWPLSIEKGRADVREFSHSPQTGVDAVHYITKIAKSQSLPSPKI